MFDSEDNDKTAMRSEETVQPMATAHFAAAAAGDHEQQAMPLGTRIAEFQITGLIGVGGFGIVYLAHDSSLGRDVALKEYMPATLANRTGGMTVRPKSASCAETFSAGMRSFINEAHMLALFDHPSLVKVYRFWEANGTAYMVMPHYEGQTLKQVLLEMGTPPSEAWLNKLLIPLMDALQLIHAKSCYHRDIAPDNILILKGGHPVLLDFGAARQVIGDMVKNLTVILKPGYAPIEQYSGDTTMPQGAWTDIYALGAVVYYAITGKPPKASVMRLLNDSSVPLAKTAAGRYSDSFLRAVDQALAVKPADRPQNIAALRSLLALGGGQQQQGGVVPQSRAIRWLGVSPRFAVPVLVAVLVAGVGLYLVLNRDPHPVALVAAPGPISVPAAPAVSATQKVEKLAQTPPGPAATPAVSTSFDPLLSLNQLFEKRELDHAVSVSLDKARLKIGKDKFSFRVQSAKTGYLYVLELESNKEHLNLLFPNAKDSQNIVIAGREITLPRSHWSTTVYGPPGTDHFVVLVSQYPRDFTEAGLKRKKGDDFGEFALDILASKSQLGTGDANILSGKPVCASASDCFAGYGAAKFSVEVLN